MKANIKILIALYMVLFIWSDATAEHTYTINRELNIKKMFKK